MDIKQSTSESYIKFIDWLKDSTKRQIEDSRAQDVLLRKLAVTNANVECKRILRTFALDPEPSVDQMVEACDK